MTGNGGIFENAQFQKIPIQPHKRNWNFLRVGGLTKTKIFKEMYQS